MKLMVFTMFLLEFEFISNERPKYRSDYRYEKAFSAFYKIHLTAVDWYEARIRCEAEGAELMVPETLDEADAMPIIIAPILNRQDGVFIGIHDLYAEGSYVTIEGRDTQNTIIGLLWAYREPNKSVGRCVAMLRSGRLAVSSCKTKLPFICKTSAAEIAYNSECDSYDQRWKKGHNGNCYMVHTDPQTWYQAYATCLSAGGHLMVINSQEEAKYLRTMFKQVPEKRIPNNFYAFLGFNDLFQKYHYRTIFGERLNDTGYKDWDSNCPQDGITDKPFRCGGIRRSGFLHAGDCDVPAMFFCEKPQNKNNFKSIGRSVAPRYHHILLTTPTTADEFY